MPLTNDALGRFHALADTEPVFVPDLTLWYPWHQQRGTLPDQWQDSSIPEIAEAMNTPVWLPVQPWRIEMHGVQVEVQQSEEERIIRTDTPSGLLVARWILGPDGDWWQVEYPIKTATDLPAALAAVRARSYTLQPAVAADVMKQVGGHGIAALEIPRRPYSDLLHEYLGWSEGLLLLAEPSVQEIIAILEEKLHHLVREVAQLPGDLVFSPDNLDGQFISPRAFKKQLADSYRTTADLLHSAGKQLLVHVGGPTRHLLKPLADAGVDGIEGIAGPPQGNATLAEARELVGDKLALWGGIPQDFLSDMHEWDRLEDAIMQATSEARQDPRSILGVADRVPVDADLNRLLAIPELVAQSA